MESAETNPATPVAGVRVSLYSLLNGQSIRDAQTPTGARGEAVLDVSRAVTQTGAVRLEVVNAQDLVILSPADGQFTVLPPVVNLTLVKKGSPLLLGPANVQAMLRRLSLEVTTLRKQGTGKPDIEQALSAWAIENGLAIPDVTQHVRQWAEDIRKQKAQATQEEQYLAELALKHYIVAAGIAGAEADTDFNSLVNLQHQQEEQTQAQLDHLVFHTQQTVSALQLASFFHEATERAKTLQKATASICRQYSASEEIAVSCVLSNLPAADSLILEGTYGEATESLANLNQAAVLLKQAIESAAFAERPGAKAYLQRRLGNVLDEAGDRSGPPNALTLLSQAVDAYNQALQYFTWKASPQDWAEIQEELGEALSDEADHSTEKQSVLLLAQAVTAFQHALEILTKEAKPIYWAGVEGNLGTTLYREIRFATGEMAVNLLQQAMDANQLALTGRPREKYPWDWAAAQINIGNVLRVQSDYSSNDQALALLEQAVGRYDQAKEVYTREQFPQRWAMVQTDLGLTLVSQARRTSSDQSRILRMKAVDTFNQAKAIFTRSASPFYWSEIMHSLANVHDELGEHAVAGMERKAANEVNPK